MADHLQDVLEAARTELKKDSVAVIVRATQLAGADPPASGEYLMLDLIPSAPTNLMDGSLYEDLLLQVGAWSDTSLTSALSVAEAARSRMSGLHYHRAGGMEFLLDDNYVGVLTTYRLVAAYDNLT